MIYTLTLNPCIDYAVYVDSWEEGKVNRAGKGRSFAGGKGINVSIVLTNLNCPNIALGFVGGYTGKEIERIVKNKGVKSDFIKIDDESRINVKILGKNETQFNGDGPDIDEKSVALLYKQLLKLKSGDYLVMSGSIPQSLPTSFYSDICKYIEDKGVKTIVDTTGQSLLGVLKYEPFLIKPNHYELGELFGVELKTREEITQYAKKLVELGAQNVIISMGEDGALFINKDGAFEYVQAPKGKVVDTVGAGDSVIAGFISEYVTTLSAKRAFYRAVATGTATAFSDELATKEESDKLYKLIKKENGQYL